MGVVTALVVGVVPPPAALGSPPVGVVAGGDAPAEAGPGGRAVVPKRVSSLSKNPLSDASIEATRELVRTCRVENGIKIRSKFIMS